MSTNTIARPEAVTPAQLRFINSLRARRALPADDGNGLDKRSASREIDRLKALPVVIATCVAAAPNLYAGIPASKYSIVEDGVRTFWELKTWRGTTYLRLLVGAPGEFQRVRVGSERARTVASILKRDPLAAAQAFASFHTCCAVCGADLSDETSVALGLGPICRRRFSL